MYNDILDARTANNPSSGSGESTKDIYRKMAPLYQKQENYTVAAQCLTNVISQEDQEILKVGHWTKVAGNYKKANNVAECVKASTTAYELMNQLAGEKDPQTCRCLINLGQVY